MSEMAQLAPSAAQIRAHVQHVRARLKEKNVNPDLAVGIRAPAKPSGAESFTVDGRPYDVIWCAGPLEARGRLADYDAGPRGLVLVTSLDDHQLGADVLARLARTRLDAVRAWDMLLEHFQARQLDPQVASKPWMAEALLAAIGESPKEAVPAGVLDAATAWRILLQRRLRFTTYPADLESLLAWTRDKDPLQRYAQLDEPFRRGLREHLISNCGPAAGCVLDAIDAGYGADVVPLGLACRVIYHPLAGDKPSFPDGAVRMEKYTLDRPLTVAAARHWATAAEAAVRRVQSTEGTNAARPLLARGDQVLADLKAHDVARLSEVLPSGFEQRLTDYAAALVEWLGDRSANAMKKLGEAAAFVEGHDQAKMQDDRTRRVRMSLRLARYLVQTPLPKGNEPAPLEPTALEYATDGGFADWARGVLAGEGLASLADAYTALSAAVADLREAQNEQFARSLVAWTQSASQPQSVLPIESVLDEVVAPLAEQGPVLLLVMDGMSYAVLRELLEDVVGRQGWVQLERSDFPRGRPVLATIPSVTEFSRTTLLTGKLGRGGQPDAAAGFASHPALVTASRNTGHPLLFHKAELSEGAGNDLSTELRKVVASNRRVIGVVVNAVDDHLLKGDQVQPRWTVEYVRVLRPLLHEAALAGRTVILASDHGHVIDRQSEYRAGDRGERWRSATTTAGAGELEVTGRRVMADGGRIVPLWSERVHFSVKKNGYHGGLSPQEMLAPLAVLVSAAGKRPGGWTEMALYEPSWWDVQQPEALAEEQPAMQATPEIIAETGKRKPPRSLWDFPKEPPTKSVEAKPALETAPAPPQWLASLLASPEFESQKKASGRTPIAEITVRAFLETLAARGNKILRPALARHLNLPPLRLPGVIAAMRRLLNFDGVDVLSMDEASDSVVLDVERLKVQFDLK